MRKLQYSSSLKHWLEKLLTSASFDVWEFVVKVCVSVYVQHNSIPQLFTARNMEFGVQRKNAEHRSPSRDASSPVGAYSNRLNFRPCATPCESKVNELVIVDKHAKMQLDII